MGRCLSPIRVSRYVHRSILSVRCRCHESLFLPSGSCARPMATPKTRDSLTEIRTRFRLQNAAMASSRAQDTRTSPGHPVGEHTCSHDSSSGMMMTGRRQRSRCGKTWNLWLPSPTLACTPNRCVAVRSGFARQSGPRTWPGGSRSRIFQRGQKPRSVMSTSTTTGRAPMPLIFSIRLAQRVNREPSIVCSCRSKPSGMLPERCEREP